MFMIVHLRVRVLWNLVALRTPLEEYFMFMSGMDPHTIRETLGWYGWELGVSQSCVLGQTAAVGSVVGSMLRFEEKSF
jgi:hypothetical protein